MAAWAFVLLGFLQSCSQKAGSPGSSDPVPFQAYSIADSGRIQKYPSGLELYIVEQGPGHKPKDGQPVLMHYCGYLENGEVFDNTFERGEPFRFIMGPDTLIPGLQEAMAHLALGSKAIVKLPPHLGYGEGRLKNNGKRELPPKIPANASLTYHLHLLGSF